MGRKNNKQGRVIDLYTKNPDLTCKDLQRMVGCSARTVKYARILARQNKDFGNSKAVNFKDEIESNKRSIVTTSAEIRTLAELLEFSNVDMEEWEIVKHTVNSWGSYKNENFQVKVWLRKRGGEELSIKEFADEFKEAIKNYSCKKYKPVKYSYDSGNAVELALHDLHFGSLCWGMETGQNYDIKIAERLFLDAVDYAIDITKSFNPDLFILPIGSDFFNVNSMLNQTVHGTPQDEDCRWQKTFVCARKMIVHAADRLKEIAPVKMFVIPGNHDEERAFYLGESLVSWYRLCDEININNDPTPRKYWAWGDGLLLMTHGKDEVKGQLPMIMATEEPFLWSRAKYREVHKGHLHSYGIKGQDLGTDNRGVKERLIGSLAAVDSWHKKKGYGSLRETNSFVWNKKKGVIADFPYHP